MALSKRTYTAGVTKITADNLNAIQDAIISQEERKPTKQEVTDALGYTPPKSSDIPSDDISANTTARHSHANKAILDKITGIVDADSVSSPGNQTDLVNYSGFQAGSQLLLQQVNQQYLKKTAVPTALKNPKQLKFTGAVTATYDGSSEVTVNIPSGGSGTGGSGQDGKSINWRGEYNGNTSYSKLDAVSYEGSAYIYSSDTASTGAIPGIDEDVWSLMAEKGSTPVKGTDYWTAADKAEIVADVLAALPDGTEVSY